MMRIFSRIFLQNIFKRGIVPRRSRSMTRSDATMKYGRSSRVADGNQASSDSEISELGEDKQQVSVK